MFQDLGRGLNRLERPGYWQNRCGFAFSLHELDANAEGWKQQKLDMIKRQFEWEKMQAKL